MLKRLIQSLTISALVVAGAIALSSSAQTSGTGRSPSMETGTGGAADAGTKGGHKGGHPGHMDGGMHKGHGHMDGGTHKGM